MSCQHQDFFPPCTLPCPTLISTTPPTPSKGREKYLVLFFMCQGMGREVLYLKLWSCFVLAPVSHLKATLTLSRMESNSYCADPSLKKGGHPISKAMFWDGVAALDRPPSFNQLFISQLELMNVQPHRNMCVFSVPVPPSWLMCLICHPKPFCALLRNTSAP